MTMSDIEIALERNRAFASAGGHEGAVMFPNLRAFVTPEVINDVAFISQIAENVLPDGPLFELP